MARPSKLTEETAAEIVRYIRAGAFPHVAAKAAGVGASTFYRWMAEGNRAKTGAKREFREHVEQAKAAARIHAEARVHADKPLDWLRLGPGRDELGNPGWTERTQLTGPSGGPVQVTAVELSPQERVERLRELLAEAERRAVEAGDA